MQLHMIKEFWHLWEQKKWDNSEKVLDFNSLLYDYGHLQW